MAKYYIGDKAENDGKLVVLHVRIPDLYLKLIDRDAAKGQEGVRSRVVRDIFRKHYSKEKGSS